LKIEKQLQEDHQMQLTVEVEQDLMDAGKRRAARKLAQRSKIPGFRPGKAPYDIIVRHFGEGAITEQAIDILVDEIYPKVLDQAEIKAAAPGSLEKIEDVDPLKLVFRVPLAPEVVLGDYHAVREPYEWSPPDSKELDDALTNLRQMYATTETVERAIAPGDFLLVDIKGAIANPKEGDEDQAEKLSRTGFAVVVRENGDEKENKWPYSGFSMELVGLKPGDSKTVNHKYPKDEVDETLRGKTVHFDVNVKTVRSMILPELDDEFAKMTGQFETLDALKESLAENLNENSRQEYEDHYFTRLIDKVIEGATIKYPPQIAEREAMNVLEEMRQRLSQQGLELDAYFKMRNTDQAKFLEEDARPVAIKRLERSLVMDELTRQEKITVDDSALQSEFGNTLNDLEYQGVDLNKISGGKKGQKEFAQAVAMESISRLLARRTLERLKAIATGEFKPEEGESEQKPKKAASKKKSAKSVEESAAGETPPSETPSTEKKAKTPKTAAKKAEKKTESE